MTLENIKHRLLMKVIHSRKLGHVGKKTLIKKPLAIDNGKSISIGDRSNIAHYGWIMGGTNNQITLKIGDDVQVGHFCHIIGMNDLCIEDNVLIADKVYIADCGHNYTEIDKPIYLQACRIFNPVKIGRDSWIGENVCIYGASVGKHCIIGANSVVTHDIPDFSVAVGSPAKVIKKYNFSTLNWENVEDIDE